MIKLLTYTDKQGNIKAQFFVLEDGTRIETQGLEIWEGEVVQVADKKYDLELDDWFHGKGEDGIDMHQYNLVEQESDIVKDATNILKDIVKS